MDKGSKQLHVLFLPYLATGHIIPCVNAARLFAFHGGVKVTILTTHHNASLFRSTIENDGHSNISIHTLSFPSAEVGLREGIENFSSASSLEIAGKIFHAIYLLQKPMEDKIREIHPHCIFSDMYFPWTVDIAKELNIPRLVFNQSSCMYHSILHNLRLYKPHQQLESKINTSTNYFSVPGLPDNIEFNLSQIIKNHLIKPVDERTPFDEMLHRARESEDRSYGIVHDTFYELESAYADYYQKIKKTKCWQIGPISHFSSKLTRRKELINVADENNSAAVVEWLNEQKHKSVLYVSFGTVIIFPENQLTEIAKALEASSVPFIWVVKKNQSVQTTWFSEGLLEDKKGLIIRGWVPQLTILDHSSVGGFMTHCGWNSVLEAINAGVPLVTWPVYAEQFYNEKLVEVMGLGVKVGAEVHNSDGGVKISSPVIESEKIEIAIERLMDGSMESQKIREKVMATSEMAKNAVEEGGSSWNNLTALIDDIKNFTSTKMD